MKNFRWIIICLIGLATVINLVDRGALAIMWKEIGKETGITENQYATITSIFLVFYALGQAVTGRIMDRVGIRLGFVLAILVWSLACVLHSVAFSALSFGVFRALLGFSEAGNWPGGTKAAAAWFPKHERAFAQGIFNAGSSLGGVISGPIIAFLYAHYDWRSTFLIVGSFGFLWVIPWWFIARSTPQTHPWVTQKERDYIADKQNSADNSASAAPAPDVSLTWLQAAKLRQTWALVEARFFLDPIWWLFATWLPIYLHKRFDFDIKDIGSSVWAPYLGAAIGSLAGGWFAGVLMRRGWNVNRARKFVIHAGALLAIAGLGIAAFATTPIPAITAIAITLCGFQIAMNNIQTFPSDFYTGKSVGTVAGMGGLAAVAGTLVFSTWLVPLLSNSSKQYGYTYVFLLIATLVPLGVASIHFFARVIAPVNTAHLFSKK